VVTYSLFQGPGLGCYSGEIESPIVDTPILAPLVVEESGKLWILLVICLWAYGVMYVALSELCSELRIVMFTL